MLRLKYIGGGGTPTYLTEEQSDRLMKMLKDHFTIAADAEVSIEMDPREIELDMLDHYAILVLTELAWVYKISIKRFKKR